MKNKNINLDHSRPGEQRRLMEQIDRDGVCPFCGSNLKKYHRQPILKQNSSWILTLSQYPYEGSRHHFLFINKKHRENILGFTPKEASDLFQLFQWVIKKYKLPGGGVFMRFGKTTHSGASIAHSHAHLINGDGRSKKNTGKFIYAPMGYRVKK